MIELDAATPQAYVEAYLLANTPAYLLKKFLAIPDTRALALANDPRELLDYVKNIGLLPNPSPADLLGAYRCLAALATSDISAESLLEAGESLWNLSWGPELISIIAAKRASTTRALIDVSCVRPGAGGPASAANNTFNKP